MSQSKGSIIHIAPLSQFPPESLANAAADSTLSFAARGFLYYLLQHHEKGFVNISELQKVNQAIKSKQTIKELMDELRERGYIVTTKFYEKNLLRYRHDCYLVPKQDFPPKPC